MEPRIIFEDEWICVIDKPAGLVTNDSSTSRNTLQSWFAKKYGIEREETEFGSKQGLVHRLDKDTSGVMVLAKTQSAYEILKKQFLERKVVKKYIALVHGRFNESEGSVALPIERNPKDKFKFAIGRDLSRMAITDWRVLEQRGDYTLVELTPHTGRTHQIRVHMKHLGHPVVADPIYGGKRYKVDIKWCPRLFLHAASLEFAHPQSRERVEFEAELPGELAKLVH